jgi:hypothetical protein
VTATPLPIDPNVRVPMAVKRGSARADELHAAMVAKPAAPAADPAPAPAPVEPPPAPAPAPAADVTPASNEPINWEHRFNSMKGRYEKERADKLALSEQLAQTQTLIAQMHTAPAPVTPDTPAELRADALLSPEVVNEYGEEFLSVVGKKAKAELLPELNAVRQQLTSISKQLEGTATANKATARQNMLATLDRDLAEWRTINVAPEFHSWLALPDEFSGAIRHELLKAAYEQNNTPRVLAFFRRFISDEAALDPAVTPQPDTTGAQPDKIPLADLAAPGRAKTAAASSAPVEKPTFTHAQIAKFYTDVSAGRFRGRDDEKNRIEKQIFDAQREGRIR